MLHGTHRQHCVGMSWPAQGAAELSEAVVSHRVGLSGAGAWRLLGSKESGAAVRDKAPDAAPLCSLGARLCSLLERERAGLAGASFQEMLQNLVQLQLSRGRAQAFAAADGTRGASLAARVCRAEHEVRRRVTTVHADSHTPLSTSEEAMDIKRREYLAANRKQA